MHSKLLLEINVSYLSLLQGLCIAILGPTLLDLQQRTHTDIKQISRVFTVRSIGYLVGSIVGGFLFNFFNHSCLVGIFLLLTAIGTALAPWWQQLSRLMACISFVGMSMGLLDTGEFTFPNMIKVATQMKRLMRN